MNEILKPELKWIEGRCYRINDPNVEISALQEHDLYENGYYLYCHTFIWFMVIK